MVNAIPWPSWMFYRLPILTYMNQRVHACRECNAYHPCGRVNRYKIGHAAWLSTIGLMKKKGNGESPGEAFSQNRSENC